MFFFSRSPFGLDAAALAAPLRVNGRRKEVVPTQENPREHISTKRKAEGEKSYRDPPRLQAPESGKAVGARSAVGSEEDWGRGREPHPTG